jgi:hypothetical protein
LWIVFSQNGRPLISCPHFLFRQSSAQILSNLARSDSLQLQRSLDRIPNRRCQQWSDYSLSRLLVAHFCSPELVIRLHVHYPVLTTEENDRWDWVDDGECEFIFLIVNLDIVYFRKHWTLNPSPCFGLSTSCWRYQLYGLHGTSMPSQVEDEN